MRNYWVTRHANAYRDVNNLKSSLLPGTRYPHSYAPHAHCPSLARPTACRGVNCLSCKCQGRICVIFVSLLLNRSTRFTATWSSHFRVELDWRHSVPLYRHTRRSFKKCRCYQAKSRCDFGFWDELPVPWSTKMEERSRDGINSACSGGSGIFSFFSHTLQSQTMPKSATECLRVKCMQEGRKGWRWLAITVCCRLPKSYICSWKTINMESKYQLLSWN